MSKLKNLSIAVLSFVRPRPTLGFWFLLLLYGLIQLTYTGVVLYKHEFSLTDPTVAVYFLEKFFFDFAVYFTLTTALSRIFRRTWPAHLFSVIYLLLIGANTVMYYFGSTLLELHHFALITPYSISSFLSVPAIAFTLLFIAILVVMRRPLKILSKRVTWGSVFRWGVVWLALAIVDVPEMVAKEKVSDKRLDKVIMVFRNAQLEYSAQNPATAFFNDIILKGFFENLYTMKGGEKYRKFMTRYNLVSEDYRISSDTGEAKEVLDKYNLPIGKRDYQDLGLEEFNKVIVIFVESLSADFMSCYNEKLQTNLTPFLCSNEVRDVTFSNMSTSGSPTLQGLTVVFSGHPNFNIQKATGNANTFPKLLKRSGYETRFIRSASKFFANENIIFKKWGFDRIDAREDFFKREDLRKFIYGWGLEDRKLYDELVALLKEKKDDKLFVSMLGTDTHPLNGQRWFKHLKYPPLPKGFNKKFGKARHFAKAIRNTDFDLRRLVGRLKEEGLYNDDTLIVITADHSCPPNIVTRRVKGHTRKPLGKIPFILLTPQKLPPVDHGVSTSQLDVAPTLFHMMGLEIPSGWWGESLFDVDRKNPPVGFDKNMLVIGDGKGRKLFNMSKDNDRTREINRVFSTVYVD